MCDMKILLLSVAGIAGLVLLTVFLPRHQSSGYSYTFEERVSGTIRAQGERKVKANGDWWEQKRVLNPDGSVKHTGTMAASIATGVVSIGTDRLTYVSPFHGAAHIPSEAGLRASPQFDSVGERLGYRTVILKTCDEVGCTYLHFAPSLAGAVLEANYPEFDRVVISVTIGEPQFSIPNLPIDRTAYDAQSKIDGRPNQ